LTPSIPVTEIPERNRLPSLSPPSLSTASAPATIATGTQKPPVGKLKSPPRLSIVVLPFANLSNDPDQQYFADGITENVTTDLSRIAHSFVIRLVQMADGVGFRWANPTRPWPDGDCADNAGRERGEPEAAAALVLDNGQQWDCDFRQ